MKRKDFIITATAAAVAVIITPILIKQFSVRKHYDPLIMPDMLGQFCNEETIREIGKTYRKLSPEENTKAKLTDLLLTDVDGKKVAATDKAAVLEVIEKKTQQEFSAYKTIIVNGWVITKTEACQCALFSLS